MCYGGQPGTNGIPGMHGMPGSPGAPGRDGREGAKGDQGSPGRTGPQGPAGAEGKKGDKGAPGTQGAAGQKGQRGEKGESGVPGSPQLSSHMNWKECTWKKIDAKDSGVIQASDIPRKHAMYSRKLSQSVSWLCLIYVTLLTEKLKLTKLKVRLFRPQKFNFFIDMSNIAFCFMFD